MHQHAYMHGGMANGGGAFVGGAGAGGAVGGAGMAGADGMGNEGVAAGGGHFHNGSDGQQSGANVGLLGGGGGVSTGGAAMTTLGGISAGCLGGDGVGRCTETACGEVESAGSLTFVGTGRGDWITETTYKYVGAGAGDLTVVTTSRSYMPMACLAAVAVALATLLLVALLIAPTPSSTIKTAGPSTTLAPRPPPMRKTCSFWGDPHIVTFDGARPSIYGDGEFWIVKHSDVKIQGRYMGTAYTYGLAATQKIAVGGPFLGGHTIEVEPMETAYGGHILVDGQVVLSTFGNYTVGNNVAKIRYDGIGELPDKAASKWESRIVHMELPKGITFTVFRWGNYLDLTLEMTPLEGGQDGSCGNFNGDATDDTTAEIFKRIGARVGTSDMLFSKRAEVSFTVEEMQMLREHCSPQMIVEGELECRKELGQNASTTQVNACVFDVCFGMNEHALQTAKKYATPEDKAVAMGKP